MTDLRPTVTLLTDKLTKHLNELNPIDLVAVDDLVIKWGKDSIWDEYTSSEATFTLWMYGDSRYYADSLQSGLLFELPVRVKAAGRTIFSGMLRSVHVSRVDHGPWGGPAWRADATAVSVTAQLANTPVRGFEGQLGTDWHYAPASYFIGEAHKAMLSYEHVRNIRKPASGSDPVLAFDKQEYAQMNLLNLIGQIYQAVNFTTPEYHPDVEEIRPAFWPIMIEWHTLVLDHGDKKYHLNRIGGQWKYGGATSIDTSIQIDACDLHLDKLGVEFTPQSRMGRVSVTAPTNTGDTDISHAYKSITTEVRRGKGTDLGTVTTCRADGADFIGRHVLGIADDLYGIPQFPTVTYALGHDAEKQIADFFLQTWYDQRAMQITGSVLHQWLDSLPMQFPHRTRIGDRMVPIGGTLTYNASEGWISALQLHPLVIANAQYPRTWQKLDSAIVWDNVHESVTWADMGRIPETEY